MENRKVIIKEWEAVIAKIKKLEKQKMILEQKMIDEYVETTELILLEEQ